MSEPKPIESETRGGSCAPAICSACGRTGTYIRTRQLQKQTAYVWMCENAACKNKHLYWHTYQWRIPDEQAIAAYYLIEKAKELLTPLRATPDFTDDPIPARPHSGLLPCPFCAGAHVGIINGNNRHFVLCCEHAECTAQVWGKTEAEAVEKWNLRSTPNAPDQRPGANQ